MANYYYYAPDKIGPVDAGRIRELAASGVITRETIIEDQGGRRYYARQIPGLFAEEVPVPPPAPPEATDNTSTAGLDPTKIYYYDANNNPVGPVTGEELEQLANNGTITPQTILTKNGVTFKAEQIKSLWEKRFGFNFYWSLMIMAFAVFLFCRAVYLGGPVLWILFAGFSSIAFLVFLVIAIIKILGNQQALIDQNKKR